MKPLPTCVLFSLFWLYVEGAAYGGSSSYGGPPAPSPCASSSGYGGSSPCSSKGHAPASPYSYSYTAPVGQYEDGMIAASESSDGHGTIKGSYSLMDPDGRMRMVSYIADAMGFRATVKTNEPGTANENPADVVMQSSYVTPAASNSGGYAEPEVTTPCAQPEPASAPKQYLNSYGRRSGKRKMMGRRSLRSLYQNKRRE